MTFLFFSPRETSDGPNLPFRKAIPKSVQIAQYHRGSQDRTARSSFYLSVSVVSLTGLPVFYRAVPAPAQTVRRHTVNASPWARFSLVLSNVWGIKSIIIDIRQSFCQWQNASESFAAGR
jgi:hypothetical protein